MNSKDKLEFAKFAARGVELDGNRVGWADWLIGEFAAFVLRLDSRIDREKARKEEDQ